MDDQTLAAARAARGFMPDDEGLALYRAGLDAAAAVPGAPLLEVGSYCGKSSVYLGAAAQESGTVLIAIDHPAARQQLFNVAMDEPVDYARAAAILSRRHGMEPVEIPTPFHSNWLDITKARMRLGWRPHIDLEALIDRAWRYERAANDARRIWYPG